MVISLCYGPKRILYVYQHKPYFVPTFHKMIPVFILLPFIVNIGSGGVKDYIANHSHKNVPRYRTIIVWFGWAVYDGWEM